MEKVFYRILRFIISVLFRILYRPKIIGKNNIPKKGRLVLAGNHYYWLDGPFLAVANRRTIYFLAKDGLHKGIKKIIFRAVGTIPVDRSIHDNNAFQSAKTVLLKNNPIGIFPEAHLNKSNDYILPFKTGAVRLARETNTYLIPFIITGDYKIFGRSNLTIEFFEKRKIKSDDVIEENEKLMKFFRKELEKRKDNEKK